MITNKIFRRILNFAMFITLLGTVPYMIGGQTQYRHEVFGVTALALVSYHCIENKVWFVQALHNKLPKKPSSRTMRFRDWINVLLIVATLIVLLSGIMISNVVFRFLGIPYHDFWHYTHFISGIAFLVLVIIHAFHHKRFRKEVSYNERTSN